MPTLAHQTLHQISQTRGTKFSAARLRQPVTCDRDKTERIIWGVDSVKSTVTALEEGDFTEEGGGFNWRGCFSVGGYHYLWMRGAF